jgi:hypothetical protein
LDRARALDRERHGAHHQPENGNAAWRHQIHGAEQFGAKEEVRAIDRGGHEQPVALFDPGLAAAQKYKTERKDRQQRQHRLARLRQAKVAMEALREQAKATGRYEVHPTEQPALIRRGVQVGPICRQKAKV